VVVLDRLERRGRGTRIERERAALDEAAARGRIGEVRHAASDGHERAGRVIGRGHGLDERLRVGVARRVQHPLGAAELDELARVQDRDAVADLGEHAEVVADQHDRRAAPLPQVVQQRQHLGLDRHVERGGRLVRDQQARIVRERHRDHGSLPHAAGELRGNVALALRCVGDADLGEQGNRALGELAARVLAVRRQRIAHLAADREAGVERRHRILHDQADLTAAQPAQLRLWQRQQASLAEADVAGHSRGRRQQAHHGEPQRRLAAAGLAGESEDLPRLDREAHLAERRHLAEADRQPIDLEQAPAHEAIPRGSSRPRSPSPSSRNPATARPIASPGKTSAHQACCSTW
jgi:hypothetical protein